MCIPIPAVTQRASFSRARMLGQLRIGGQWRRLRDIEARVLEEAGYNNILQFGERDRSPAQERKIPRLRNIRQCITRLDECLCLEDLHRPLGRFLIERLLTDLRPETARRTYEVIRSEARKEGVELDWAAFPLRSPPRKRNKAKNRKHQQAYRERKR